MDPLVQSSQKLQSRYGVQQSQFNRIGVGGGVASKPVAAPKGPDYLGNVFNSIKSGVGAGAGAVGGFLHKSLIEEPSAWGKYVGGNLNTFARVPLNAIQNYQQFQKDHNFEAYRQAQKGLMGTTVDSFRGSAGGVPTKELVEKGLPVGLTAASLVLPFVKGGTVAKGAANVGDLSLLQKAENWGTKFGSNMVTGNGNIAANFSNPITNNAAKLASGLTYNALVTRPTVDSFVKAGGDIGQVGNNLIHGEQLNYNLDTNEALVNAAGIAAPALLTGAQKVAKGAAGVVGKNIFNKPGSVLHQLEFKGGEKLSDFLKNSPDKEKYSKIAKVAEAHIQGEAKRAEDIIQYQAKHGNEVSKMTAKEFLDQQAALANSSNKAQNTVKKLIERAKNGDEEAKAKLITSFGNIPTSSEVSRIGVGKFDQSEAAGLIKRVEALGGDGTKVQRFIEDAKAAKEPWTLNPNVSSKVQLALTRGDITDVASEINSITRTRNLGEGLGLKLKNGYFPIMKPKGAAGFVRPDKAPDLIAGETARFGKVGEVLRKSGLSPEEMTAQDNKRIFNKFKNEFQSQVEGIGDRTGKTLYTELNDLAERTPGVTDIRQLTSTKISKELNITTDQAKQIIKAAKDSYKVLSVEERGLAGKLMDFNLRKNPLAAPYSRAQSLARYEWNPFFRLQENMETRTGLAALGGKNVMPRSHRYDETIKKLNGEHGIFTSGYGSEGADSFSGSFSGVGAKISRDQENNIAASIEKFAGGPDKVDSWLANPKNADLLNDIKTVVQYPDKGFTSSNLAKMMNLVSFPSRYNLKVTQFAVKQFMKQPAPVQMSIIKGLGDFHEFVNSPEGTKWQADNKEVIGLFKYLTPIMPIASVYQTITGQNKTLLDTGMMGGLPFGIITRVLQGQGVLKDRVPYVDPKTGKVYSDRIPQDLKAKAESFLNSIVDTLYTYPGRTAGLETSKKQLTQGIVDNATFGKLKGGEYSETDRSGDVTPEQQNQIKVLQSMSSNTPKFSNNPTEFVQTTNYKPAPVGNFPSIYKKAKKGKKAKPIAKPIGSFL